jgi:hypothetical protein
MTHVRGRYLSAEVLQGGTQEAALLGVVGGTKNALINPSACCSSDPVRIKCCKE